MGLRGGPLQAGSRAQRAGPLRVAELRERRARTDAFQLLSSTCSGAIDPAARVSAWGGGVPGSARAERALPERRAPSALTP